MREAIDKGFLTPYYYYPYFVNLEHTELEQYLELTRQLVRHFDFNKGKFRMEFSDEAGKNIWKLFTEDEMMIEINDDADSITIDDPINKNNILMNYI